MDALRLAIAGCGDICVRIHLPVIQSIRGLRVTVIADPDRAARERAAAVVPHASAIDDWSGVLSRDDVDAVLVALPSHMHAAAAEAVIRAGRHLYLEKPIAITLAEASPVVDAARDSDASVMLGFNYRFNPLFARLRGVVADGAIGRLIVVRTVFSTHGAGGGWRADPANGGVLVDLASHHADLVPYITDGRARAVRATLSSRVQQDDTAAVTIELDNDITAQCLFTTAGPEQDTIELIGDQGTAVVRRYESLAVEMRGRNAADARRDQLRNVLRTLRAAPYLVSRRRAPGNEPSYRTAMDRFLQSVRHGKAASPGVQDGIAALTIIEAARKAAATGRTVRIDDAAQAGQTGIPPAS